MSFTRWPCNESDSFLRPLPPLPEYIWIACRHYFIKLRCCLFFGQERRRSMRWSSEQQEEESDLAIVLTIDLLKRVIIMIGDNW